jgi:hypothetical protein
MDKCFRIDLVNQIQKSVFCHIYLLRRCLFYFGAWNVIELWDAIECSLFQTCRGYWGIDFLSLSIFSFKLTMEAVYTSEYRMNFYQFIRRLCSQQSPLWYSKILQILIMFENPELKRLFVWKKEGVGEGWSGMRVVELHKLWFGCKSERELDCLEILDSGSKVKCIKYICR